MSGNVIQGPFYKSGFYDTGAGGDLPEGLTAVEYVIPISSNYKLEDMAINIDDLEFTLEYFLPAQATNTNGNYVTLIRMMEGADGGGTNRIGVQILGHGGGYNNIHYYLTNGGTTNLPTMYPFEKGKYSVQIKNNNAFVKTPMSPDGTNYSISYSSQNTSRINIDCGTGGDWPKIAIKNIKGVKNGETLFDVVGVKRNYDGKISLFDKVTNIFDETHTYTEYVP